MPIETTLVDLEAAPRGSMSGGLGRPQKYPWSELLNGAVWSIGPEDLESWGLKDVNDFRQRFVLKCRKTGQRPITRKVGSHHATAVLLVQAKEK